MNLESVLFIAVIARLGSIFKPIAALNLINKKVFFQEISLSCLSNLSCKEIYHLNDRFQFELLEAKLFLLNLISFANPS